MAHLFKNLLLVTFFSTAAIQAQPNYPRDPAAAQLIGVDVENFIVAYKSLTAESDTSAVIQEMYLNKATQGLAEYVARFNLTAKDIANAIEKYPTEYSKIEKFASSI